MKKFLSIISALVLTASAVPAADVFAQADIPHNGITLTYEITDGKACITGCTGSDAIVMIPSEINGSKVTSIKSNAFMGVEELTAVVIPDSVDSIGDRAFSACPLLTTVTLGSGVNEIGSMAFSACPSLESFFVSKDNKTFSVTDKSLFEGTELVTYAGGSAAEIPVGTVSVRKGAFMGKTNIISVEFPKNGLTSLGDYTFSGCTSLKKASIPSSVTYTGTGCFASCYALEDVLFSLNCTSIEDDTFRGCTSLYNINIPSTVTSIGDSAFLGCSELSGMYIPPTVKELGTDAVGRSYNIRNEAVETISGFELHADKGSAAEKYAQSADISVKPFMIGDVNNNGIIEGSDATMALRMYTLQSSEAVSEFNAYQTAAADWNNDDMITGSDATMILMEYTHLQSGVPEV